MLIQVYMPTSNHQDDEAEKVYEDTDGLLKRIRGEENLILMSDWNAMGGESTDRHVVGPYELRERNERGDWLMRVLYTASTGSG